MTITMADKARFYNYKLTKAQAKAEACNILLKLISATKSAYPAPHPKHEQVFECYAVDCEYFGPGYVEPTTPSEPRLYFSNSFFANFRSAA